MIFSARAFASADIRCLLLSDASHCAQAVSPAMAHTQATGGEPLPGIPMYHGLKRVPRSCLKGGAVGIGNRDQGDLCHLGMGNPQELRRFFFAVEMKDGPTRAETTRTGGKHEAPRRWHNGTGNGMLQSQWESLKTR